eukprot:GHVU01156148.1.p1 GENE.GHVU01156148.1~~GHVU01156148.1.p1  ORF type:complete len:200 (+),score=12.85 GHVU01156148.1:336-935(+)
MNSSSLFGYNGTSHSEKTSRQQIAEASFVTQSPYIGLLAAQNPDHTFPSSFMRERNWWHLANEYRPEHLPGLSVLMACDPCCVETHSEVHGTQIVTQEVIATRIAVPATPEIHAEGQSSFSSSWASGAGGQGNEGIPRPRNGSGTADGKVVYSLGARRYPPPPSDALGDGEGTLPAAPQYYEGRLVPLCESYYRPEARD